MGLERMGTHSESCYKWHLECAVSRYEALRARVAEAERLLQMAASVCDNGAFMLATEIREWLAGNKEESRNA